MVAEKKLFWILVILSYLLLVWVNWVLFLYSPSLMGDEWNWGLALSFVLVLYTVASFRKVGPTQLGLRIFLGRPMDEVASGFVFVPFGIFELELETRLIIQAEFPADPEHIYRAHKDDLTGIVPTGKFPPIRIPFGKPQDQASNSNVLDRDPFSMRLVEEVVPIVRFKIIDYKMFLTVIKTVDAALGQLQDLCVAILSREFGTVTPSEVIGNYAKYNKILTDEIQESVKSWGIELESAKVKVINFSHDLNKAVQKIAENTASGKAHVIEAQSLKEAEALVGQGKGAAEKAILEGRTAGLKCMAIDLGLEGHHVLAAETARGITNNPGQRTIIAGSGGFKDLAVVGSVLGETLTLKEVPHENS